MSDTSVRYVFEIVDKAGVPLRNISTTLDKIDRKRVKDPLRDIPKSLAKLRGDLSRYKSLQESSFRTDHIRKYNKLIDATKSKIDRLEKSTASCKSKTEGLFSKLGISKGMVTGGAILMIGRQIAKAGMEAVKASAQFESYGVTLKTMLGSAGAARERMTEYADIAKSTPFELRQVVEGGNQLQAIGRYSRENLTMLGDLAAASGKPIEQVMGAYAKLATGQKGEGVNMFRDLLISTDDWAEATGKGLKANNELAASTEEMIKALPKILGKKGFFGMMEQQAKTTQGRMSNLADSVDMLKVAVGDRLKPAYDSFLTSSTNLVESMTKMVEVPVSEKIAREKAELNALVGVITSANIGEEQRMNMLRQLQQEYPEFLGNIDLETVKNDELLTKLEEVNGAYEEKIRLASIKSIKDEGQQELEEKKAERDRLMLLKQSFGSYKDLESFFGKENYENARSKAGGQGMSFNDYLEMIARSKEKKYLETQDSEILDWLVKYREYQGVRSQVKDSGGFYEAQNNLEKKINKVSSEINIQQAFVSATDRKQKEQEWNVTLTAAKGIDTKDKSTFDKLFGKDELAKEFTSLRESAIKEFGSLKPEDWDRMSGFIAGNFKYRKQTVDTDQNPTGTPTLDGLEQATNTITGGGRQVKNITINLESLIGENNNIFRPGEGVEDGDDFMQKLTRALQLVLNDVNYAV
ncbi:MAG: hypothetical protein PHY20_02595 [Bacteroidales bacterium]|nr:hypothetical protein [Bacteroidales bacterium]